MPREAQKKEIDGLSYSVTPLGTTEGLKVLNRLQKLVAAGASAEHFVAGVLAALTETDTLFLCDTFKKLTLVEIAPGKEPCLKDFFEDHFTANYGALVQWLKFCLEVNYGSLFTLAESLGMSLSANLAGKSGGVSEPASAPITK
jgi:hypothetical protein